eukprot:30969-Hanusia_phi.AAC.1
MGKPCTRFWRELGKPGSGTRVSVPGYPAGMIMACLTQFNDFACPYRRDIESNLVILDPMPCSLSLPCSVSDDGSESSSDCSPSSSSSTPSQALPLKKSAN